MPASLKPQIVTPALEKLRRLVVDGWENVTSGHGTSRDKRSSNRAKVIDPSSGKREIWEDIYFGDDVAARIAHFPSKEMVREWITLTTDSGDTETDSGERDDAHSTSDTELADEVLQQLDDLDARTKLIEALTWARVFGGSLVFMAADDGGGLNGDMSKPLNEDRIRSLSHLTVFDRWDVEIERDIADPFDPRYGEPEIYRIVQRITPHGGGTAEPVLIHESRVLRFDGVKVNRNRRQKNSGWHDPIYARLEEILGDFGISWAGAAHALTDFAQAVFKMKGLGDAISSDESNLVLERMRIMDLCRSTLRMIPIDADDEEFVRVATPLTGVADLLDRFMLRVSAAAEMPVSILFGMGPTGLDNTAEGDIEIWANQIKGMQDESLRKQLERLLKIAMLAKDSPTKGREPDKWAMKFNPLFQLDETEKAEVRKTQAETDDLYIGNGVLEPDEVRDSRFAGVEWSAETQLNDELREEAEPDPPPFPPPTAVPPVPPALPEPPEPPTPDR